MKKCRFHQDEVRFLGFVLYMDGIRVEEKRIYIVKKLPKTESVRDILIFIGFANFYQRFIKGFNRIAAPLIAMLKTTGSSVTSTSRVDDGEIVGGGDAIGGGAIGGSAIGRSDISKKSAKL